MSQDLSAESSSSESEEEGYEIIETYGAARSIVEELISLDLANRTNVQQLCIGGASGWFAGYVCKKIGKMTLSTIGGGIVLLQIAHHKGYIKINWNRVEQDTDILKKKVKKKVKTVGLPTDEKGITAWTKRGASYVKRNVAAASAFAGGFLIGFAF